MAPSILLVGTGLTGAIAASLLQKKLPMAKILLWDKARGAGGRMCVCRNPMEGTCQADLGAQYISTTNEAMEKNRAVYCSLQQNKIIEELSGHIEGMKSFTTPGKHFVAPQGMSSIVKHFLGSLPKDSIFFKHTVKSIDKENDKYVVRTVENESCAVDAVILTIPVPQALAIEGSIQRVLNNMKKLKKVRYSNRFVLVLFYDKRTRFPDQKWCCKYIDHDVIRYVSIDNLKRNKLNDPTAVVVQTNVQFGKEHLEESLPDMEKQLLQYIQELFPDWPEPSAIRCHKWRYSQVTASYPGKPGCLLVKEQPFLLRNPFSQYTKPTLLLGGDSFADSSFDNCVYSATKIAETVCKIWSS